MGVLLRQDKTATGTTRRGGARPGAGRPRKTLGESIKDQISKSIKGYERKTGKAFWDRLIETATGAERDNDSTRAYQLLLESLVSKQAAQSPAQAKQETGPAIMLPELLPDPADKIRTGTG